MLLFVVLTLEFYILVLAQGADFHIRPEGIDQKGCGGLKKPCHTMRYAIAVSDKNTFLNVEGTRSFEFLFGPIEIRHDVTIRPYTSDYVQIDDCGNISGIFIIAGNELRDPLTVTLNRVHLNNCTSKSLISISNARLNIINCTFSNSGTLVKHEKDSENCSQVHLHILRSRFIKNFIHHPFEPAISLRGCNFTSMSVTNSQFYSSPISLGSDCQNLSFTNIDFTSHNKMTYFFQTRLSGQADKISFLNCSFVTTSKMKTNPLTLLLDKVYSEYQSTIYFQNSNFTSIAASSGAAIYIGSTMDRPMHTNIKIVLKNCKFLSCSAEGNGGSLFVRNTEELSVISCSFSNNSATNGGALYIKNVKEVRIVNSAFIFNQAKVNPTYASRGGAIFSTSSGLNISGSSFLSNEAIFEGHALYSFGDNLSIAMSAFSSKSLPLESSPSCSLVDMKCGSNICPVINISKVHISTSHPAPHAPVMGLIMAEGRIRAKNFENSCPPTHALRNSSIESDASSYQFKLVYFWCERK